MSRSTESIIDKLSRPFMRFFGMMGFEITSEQAKIDHGKLLDRAQRQVRIAAEEIEYVELLDGLAARGIQIELVVGPTQDRRSLAHLEEKGVRVSQLDSTIVQSITIVDGSHVRVTEPKLPGRSTQNQYIAYDSADIYEQSQLFENLSSKARKP